MFKGKTILITGGTGTFGNAVLRDMLQTNVGEIRVFSRDEKKQHDMRIRYNSAKLKFIIGDVRAPESLLQAVAGADLVFHAAALKQVPSCEFFPLEAIKTNALGTENVLSAAIAAGVSRVIVLSTDKAVYPVNAMGMSKGLMEKIAIAKSRLTGQKTTINVTRYGNVMGSRGSVIPLFIKQAMAGQPLTITDPEMTRFMMSIEEAVKLVNFAFQFGRPGDIFVQKATSATIKTLAEAVKKVLGIDVPIRIIGTRHGEKKFETLLTREELAVAEDLQGYYRVPTDERDLNYDLFFSEGQKGVTAAKEYNSHGADLLSLDEMCAALEQLECIKNARRGVVEPD